MSNQEEVVEFTEMTNAALLELTKDFGLTVESNIPGKPNKKELVKCLEDYKHEQAVKNGLIEEDEAKDEEEVTTTVTTTTTTKKAKKKGSSKIELLKADLFRKERVTVTDNLTSQTKGEVVSVGWGNRAIGGQNDMVLLGKPQYVRRGALKNLAAATMIEHRPKELGGEETVKVKRYSIVPEKPLTKEELEQLATRKAMRDSKF
jgi:hypothetical protein